MSSHLHYVVITRNKDLEYRLHRNVETRVLVAVELCAVKYNAGRGKGGGRIPQNSLWGEFGWLRGIVRKQITVLLRTPPVLFHSRHHRECCGGVLRCKFPRPGTEQWHRSTVLARGTHELLLLHYAQVSLCKYSTLQVLHFSRLKCATEKWKVGG